MLPDNITGWFAVGNLHIMGVNSLNMFRHTNILFSPFFFWDLSRCFAVRSPKCFVTGEEASPYSGHELGSCCYITLLHKMHWCQHQRSPKDREKSLVLSLAALNNLSCHGSLESCQMISWQSHKVANSKFNSEVCPSTLPISYQKHFQLALIPQRFHNQSASFTAKEARVIKEKHLLQAAPKKYRKRARSRTYYEL